MKKVKISLIVFGLFLIYPVVVFAQSGYEKIQAFINHDLKVELNGEKIELKNKAINYNGSNYLPMREVADLLGVEIIWDEKTKTVKLIEGKETENSAVTSGGKTIVNDSVFYSVNDVSNNLRNKYLFSNKVEEYEGKRFTISSERIDETLVTVFIQNGTKYYADFNDTAYIDNRLYATQEVLFQFLPPEDLEGLQKYQIDVENKTVTPIN